MQGGTDHVFLDHVLAQSHALGDLGLRQAFQPLPDEHLAALERQFRQRRLQRLAQLPGARLGHRVAQGAGVVGNGIKRHPFLPAVAAELVNGRVARGLVQVGAWLRHLRRVRFQALDQRVVGQVARGIPAAQLAGPDRE